MPRLRPPIRWAAVKPTFRTKAQYVGECHKCGRTWHSPNAMGLAAQHAEKCGGYVWVERTVGYVWNKADSPEPSITV